MKTILLLRLCILHLLAALALGACQLNTDGWQIFEPSSRILFIGNSFTFFNGGVDAAVRGFAPSIQVKQLAQGGYSLQDHWDAGEAVKTIRAEKWNYVVLQDQSQRPVIARNKFVAYAAKFNSEVQSAGGKTILFMTWERPDSVQYGVTTKNLSNAYYAAGNQLGAEVAPVGLAFAAALQERPGLALNIQDGHPTPAGTYLAACVVYATIFDKTPVGNRYWITGITKDEQDFLQKIAAQVMGY